MAESRRLLGVLDQPLEGRHWIMGSAYGVANTATFPWLNNLLGITNDHRGARSFWNSRNPGSPEPQSVPAHTKLELRLAS